MSENPQKSFYWIFNLRETIFCLDFFTCPQNIFLAEKTLLFDLIGCLPFQKYSSWLEDKPENYTLIYNVQRKNILETHIVCKHIFQNCATYLYFWTLGSLLFGRLPERGTVRRRQHGFLFLLAEFSDGPM